MPAETGLVAPKLLKIILLQPVGVGVAVAVFWGVVVGELEGVAVGLLVVVFVGESKGPPVTTRAAVKGKGIKAKKGAVPSCPAADRRLVVTDPEAAEDKTYLTERDPEDPKDPVKENPEVEKMALLK